MMSKYGNPYTSSNAVRLALKAGMSLEEFNKLYEKVKKMISIVDNKLDDNAKNDKVIMLMIEHIQSNINNKGEK